MLVEPAGEVKSADYGIADCSEGRMFRLTAEEIAKMTGGEAVGAADVEIEGPASLEGAGPHDVSFLQDDRMAELAAASKAGAILARSPIQGYGGCVIVCEDPHLAFSRVLARYGEEMFPRPSGVSESASISSSAEIGSGAAVGSHTVIEDGARIGEDAVIYPLVYVGRGAGIGDRTVLYPHVCVREHVRIGSDCIIHCNSVIGDDGFGYIQREGRHVKLPQVGGVRIGNCVEIGSLCTVDRAAMDETVIGDGVKIDSHSHLAHNVSVGDDSLLVAYAKVAGSATLGRGVVLAEDAGVSDHVTVGDGAVLGASAGAAQDVAPGETVWGNPARPIALQRRIWALLGRLPEMHRKIQSLEGEIELLRRQIADMRETGASEG